MATLISVDSVQRNDPEKPNLVWAIGVKRDPVLLFASPQTIRRLEDGRLNAKIGEYCGLVHGRVLDGTGGLMTAQALYRGLKRPLINIGKDADMYVYVLNPDRSFTFPVRAKYSGDGPIKTPKPVDSVFVVYVDFSEDSLRTNKAPDGTSGVILFWEWVLADDKNRNLPARCGDRYATKVWSTGEGQ